MFVIIAKHGGRYYCNHVNVYVWSQNYVFYRTIIPKQNDCMVAMLMFCYVLCPFCRMVESSQRTLEKKTSPNCATSNLWRIVSILVWYLSHYGNVRQSHTKGSHLKPFLPLSASYTFQIPMFNGSTPIFVCVLYKSPPNSPFSWWNSQLDSHFLLLQSPRLVQSPNRNVAK